eukprot:gene33293-40276_t
MEQRKVVLPVSVVRNEQYISKTDSIQTLTSPSSAPEETSKPLKTSATSYGVVAATIMVYQPRWFQRRYSLMVQNIYNNIPEGVKIQIFHGHDKDTLAGIEMSQSIQDLRARGVVVLTPLPLELLRVKKKKLQLLTDSWVWTNMIGEKVLLFAGTTAICSNSPRTLGDFLRFDYIGAPWSAFRGLADAGRASVRGGEGPAGLGH